MKIKELIKRKLSGKKVILLFLITNLVYAFMLFITIPTVNHFSGGMKLLDLSRTGYTPAYVNSLLNTLGEEGRHAYLFSQIPVDMIYPLLSGVTYCLVIAYFLNKLGKFNSVLFYACLLPLFSGFFDYLENIGIISILNRYPHNSNLLTQTTSVFTVLKVSIASLYFIVLLLLLIAFGLMKLLTRDHKNTSTES